MMKLRILALTTLLLAAPPALAKEHPSLPLPSPVPCATPACPAEPEKLKAFLIQFFMWYNAEDSACLSRGGDAYRACQTRKRKSLKKVLTPSFYKNFDAIGEKRDADPVVLAQDGWADIGALPIIEDLHIEKIAVRARVRLPYPTDLPVPENPVILDITLIPHHHVWAIGSILPASKK